MDIKVKKITDVSLLRLANCFTSGRDSKMSLATAYKLGHTTIRSQLFVVEMTDIPLYVASQLVRQTQGVMWYQRSKRTDRGGADFRKECEEYASLIWKAHQDEDGTMVAQYTDELMRDLPKRYDRYAPTDLMCLINAEALMNMARKRLCSKASADTMAVVAAVRNGVERVDPDLAKHMVPQCIYRGGICPESKPCGTFQNEKMLKAYKSLF